MYDWANSAFQCTIITAVFPVYYSTVAATGSAGAEATARFAHRDDHRADDHRAWSRPILGAYADFAARKKRMLGGFMAIGVLATAAMGLIGRGRLAACRDGCSSSPTSGSPAASSSTTRCCRTSRADEEMDRVSTRRLCAGIPRRRRPAADQPAVDPEAALVRPRRQRDRVAAVVPQRGDLVGGLFDPDVPSRAGAAGEAATADACARAARSKRRSCSSSTRFASSGRYRQAALMLLAFLIYNDGIGTIIRMAGIYGAELKLPETALVGAIVHGAVRRHSVRVPVRTAGRRGSERSARSFSRSSSTSSSAWSAT